MEGSVYFQKLIFQRKVTVEWFKNTILSI